MTATDSLTPSASLSPLPASDPASLLDFLDQQVDELAALLDLAFAALALQAARSVVGPDVAPSPDDLGLVAAPAPWPAPPVPVNLWVDGQPFGGQPWDEFVDVFVGPKVAQIYRGASLSAVIGAQPPPKITDLMYPVINDQAVAYTKIATNRIVGAGQATWSAVRDELTNAVGSGMGTEDLTKLTKQITGYSEFRSNTIARTEVMGAFNHGDNDAAVSLAEYGPVNKSWLAAVDARTRESHVEANGQTVEFADSFMVGGNAMPFPGSGPPEEVINCRCVALHYYPGDTLPDGTIAGPHPAAALAAPAMPEPVESAPLPKNNQPKGLRLNPAELDNWIAGKVAANPKVTAHALGQAAKAEGLSISPARIKSTLARMQAGGGTGAADVLEAATTGGPTGKAGKPSVSSKAFMDKHDHPVTELGGRYGIDSTPGTAARRYTASSSAVNDSLRRTGQHAMTGNLDQLMLAPKAPIEVYRGTTLHNLPTGGVEALQGKVLRDRAYLSTSAGAAQGPAFGGNIGLRITVNEHGGGAWIQPISSFKREREFLVGRDQALYVNVVRKADPLVSWESKYSWIVEAETVSPEWVADQAGDLVWDSNKGEWAPHFK